VLAAIQLAPSAGDLQALRIHLIVGEARKRQLVAAAFGQDFIAEAPLVLVFFADTTRSAGKYGARGAALFSVQDATIAAAYTQLAATDLGLSSCWIGAFDERRVIDATAAPGHLRPVALLPLGYAAEQPERPPRRSIEELVRFDR
jgi:nitroreductase